MKSDGPHGLLLIDKPRGPTSHDVVAKLRKRLHTRRVGHGGTLDPMATGVLVVLVGEATKLEPFISAQTKSYAAEITLGASTSTLDADGEVVERAPLPPWLGPEATPASPPFQAALAQEIQRTSQVPPVHSAIRVDGVRSYDRARRGEDFTLPPRDVSVAAMTLDAVRIGGALARVSLTLTVSKGYYVRSLARDLGAHLGLPAHLTALRRIASGPFTIDLTTPLDVPDELLKSALFPLEKAAALALPTGLLTAEGTARARVGKALEASHFEAGAPSGLSAWLDASQELVAVGERLEDQWLVRRGFTKQGACG